MRRFAYLIFPAIALVVALFIVILMIDINPSSSDGLSNEQEKQTVKSLFVTHEQSSWMDGLRDSREKDYYYPINEVSITLHSKSMDSNTLQYRLKASLKDSYEFFCFKQEIKKSSLPYLLSHSGEQMRVEIDSHDILALNDLVERLKTYQILATVSPLKED